MTNTTPHGQVPEALIDLIDAYAETRYRCGGIYNARTEAARKAVIEALSGVQALSAAPGDVLDEALRERDDAEDFIDALLDEVLGHERPEWSSSYGRADALNDVQERMTALHKPAVDKAWGRFQSAMAALQQDEPVGEVVSAQLRDRKMRWLHQTSSVGGGDPRNSRAWPKVSGVSRDESHSRALLVFFAAEPTDDEARAVHDTLAAAPTAMAAPRQEAQEPVAWRHSKTLCLYETKAEVPLADGDEWAEPLYATPQPAPVAQGDAEDAARLGRRSAR